MICCQNIVCLDFYHVQRNYYDDNLECQSNEGMKLKNGILFCVFILLCFCLLSGFLYKS